MALGEGKRTRSLEGGWEGREGRGGEAGDREVKARGGGGEAGGGVAPGEGRADEKSWLKRKRPLTIRTTMAEVFRRGNTSSGLWPLQQRPPSTD